MQIFSYQCLDITKKVKIMSKIDLSCREKSSLIMIGMIMFAGLFTISIKSFQINESSVSESNNINASSNFAIHQASDPTYVICSIIEKETIGWLSAYVIVEIETDGNILIDYLVTGANLVSKPITDISLSAGINKITIPITPTPDKFPGKYNYTIIMHFTNSSSGTPSSELILFDSGTIRITMGITMFVILLGTTFVGLIVILLKEEKLKKEPTNTANSAQAYIPGSSTSTSAATSSQVQPTLTEINTNNANTKAGYIMCPDCKEEIVEGSSFCPECGFHIPRFLRTQQ
jgi:hypothetical protein